MSRGNARSVTDEERRQMAKCFLAGMKISEISRMFGRDRQVVRDHLKKSGVWEYVRRGGNEFSHSPAELIISWGWDWEVPDNIKVPGKRGRSKDGYRIVYPGDRGIITPFRPDGIWR